MKVLLHWGSSQRPPPMLSVGWPTSWGLASIRLSRQALLTHVSYGHRRDEGFGLWRSVRCYSTLPSAPAHFSVKAVQATVTSSSRRRLPHDYLHHCGCESPD